MELELALRLYWELVHKPHTYHHIILAAKILYRPLYIIKKTHAYVHANKAK